jgi:cytochrome b
MKTIKALRLYHAVLAILTILAYFSDDLRRIHAYLGYAVSAVIVFRLLWSLKGEALSLKRLLPSFEGFTFRNALAHPALGKMLTLTVFLSLSGASITGIALDKGRAFTPSPPPQHRPEIRLEQGTQNESQPRERHRKKSPMRKAHAVFADIFLLAVILHIAHMFAFRRSFAKYMCFVQKDKENL